jgi:hypothetical protein
MRDLKVRMTNPVIKEYCHIAYTLIAVPLKERAAIDERAAELVAAAEARRKQVEAESAPQSPTSPAK